MTSVSVPVTWRPRRARAVALVMATAVMALMIVLAFIVEGSFKLPDRIGLVLFGALVAGIMYIVTRSRATADADGLTVVNPLRTHRLAWAEILAIGFEPGQPWPYLDLADGRTLGVLGIQGSEGPSARAAADDLRSLLEQYGEAQEPERG
ncbi:PH domain-containing protein [Actinocorallia lasiicapitis]